MTNYEKYKDEVDKITRMGSRVAIDKDTREIDICCIIPCERCFFNDATKDCQIKAIEWAEAEYTKLAVDWSKVPVDTPILVKSEGDRRWCKRYFAGLDKKGHVMGWDDGRTSWSVSAADDRTQWEYAKLAKL